jgi:Family of unknown function (DUF5996)
MTSGLPATGYASDAWPDLPYDSWQDTKATLHMYTQVLGKLRLSLAPHEPEWMHVPLYVTASGLTTEPMPYRDRVIQADLDLVNHRCSLSDGDGTVLGFPLPGRSVAGFYADVLGSLRSMRVDVEINPKPQEVPDPVPFPEDGRRSYDPGWVRRFHHTLTSADQVFTRFRAGFRGRHSRVQFFWGSFDLNYVRFSGRAITPPPGAGLISREAMDAEQYCCGFWPGDHRHPAPAFFSYAYPPPDGIKDAAVRPVGAAWHEMGEFVLPYDAIRGLPDPAQGVLDFFASTYHATASLARWQQP